MNYEKNICSDGQLDKRLLMFNDDEAPNLSMFRAYDIRTQADRLEPESALRLIHAIARYARACLNTNEIVLCRDTRLSGARFLQQAVETFAELGFQVRTNPTPISTCHFYYCCMRSPQAAGIMYSASHNPGAYTGQKIVGPQVQPIAMDLGPAGGLRKIREFYRSGSTVEAIAGGTITCMDFLADYVAYSMRLAGVQPGGLQGLPILMDFLSGTAGAEFSQAFTKAGAQVTYRNLIPDGDFPAGEPNPIIRKSVLPTLGRLSKGDYRFAFCFDGDGDRLDIIAATGEQISPSMNIAVLAPHLQALFAPYALGKRKLTIGIDPKANPIAHIALAKEGVAIQLVKSGHSRIKTVLHERASEGFIAAVEESAHYYLNFPLDPNSVEPPFFAMENTLFFGLLTARIWHEDPKRYLDTLELQRNVFRQREWGYRYASSEQRQSALSEIEQAFLLQGACIIKQTDDGQPLDATLFRQGIPLKLDRNSRIPTQWLQVSQRISESEDGLARWEVTAGTEELKQAAVDTINSIASRFTDSGAYIG